MQFRYLYYLAACNKKIEFSFPLGLVPTVIRLVEKLPKPDPKVSRVGLGFIDPNAIAALKEERPTTKKA